MRRHVCRHWQPARAFSGALHSGVRPGAVNHGAASVSVICPPVIKIRGGRCHWIRLRLSLAAAASATTPPSSLSGRQNAAPSPLVCIICTTRPGLLLAVRCAHLVADRLRVRRRSTAKLRKLLAPGHRGRTDIILLMLAPGALVIRQCRWPEVGTLFSAVVLSLLVAAIRQRAVATFGLPVPGRLCAPSSYLQPMACACYCGEEIPALQPIGDHHFQSTSAMMSVACSSSSLGFHTSSLRLSHRALARPMR